MRGPPLLGIIASGLLLSTPSFAGICLTWGKVSLTIGSNKPKYTPYQRDRIKEVKSLAESSLPPGRIVHDTRHDAIWWVKGNAAGPFVSAQFTATNEPGVLVVRETQMSNAANSDAATQCLLGQALEDHPGTKAIMIKVEGHNGKNYPWDRRQYPAAMEFAKSVDQKLTEDPDSVRNLPAYRNAAKFGYTKIDWSRSGILRQPGHDDSGCYFLHLEQPDTPQ